MSSMKQTNSKQSPHIRTRTDHRSESASDYVEAVAQVIASNGVCRLRDLAEIFQITDASTHRAISRLKDLGLLESVPYGPISLTRKGRDLACKSQDIHRLVVEFLKAIGVPQDVAEIDAEGIEHHVSKETVAAFREFLNKNFGV